MRAVQEGCTCGRVYMREGCTCGEGVHEGECTMRRVLFLRALRLTSPFVYPIACISHPEERSNSALKSIDY